jgi:hypothetical protein
MVTSFLHKERYLLVLLLAGWSSGAVAQQRLIREESVSNRRNEINALPVPRQKSQAIRIADSLGLPVRMIYPDGRVVEISTIGPSGQPEYLTTHNINAARSLSTDEVWPDGGAGYRLTGEGIVVGLWDGGVFRSSHVEFEGRAVVIDQFADVIGHATHVAGTIGAAGIDERAQGMAGEVVLEAYDWDRDVQEMGIAAREGLLISNHSYGYVTGWDYNQEENRWEWFGDQSLSETEDFLFGFYTDESQDYDGVAYENPYYLIVKSAGNDRGEGPSPGTEHYVWESGSWVPSTVVRQKDGGEDGFDSMGPVSTSKNILTVGSIRDLPLGYTTPENVMISGFSAYGPTDDGRIKPDLVGNGEQVYSTYSGSDTDYSNSSGTSMSAPNISGSLALLQELHYSLYGTYLWSSALKGVILHTAGDAGSPGPDYRYGWGVMNTRAAADVIADPTFDRIVEDSLTNNGEFREIYYADGGRPVRVTICWTDPPGRVPEPDLDPVIKILMNDLDIRLVRLVDSFAFQPYILDPIHPELPAITGDNDRDNMEQIYLDVAAEGFYEVVISHKGSLVDDRQYFALILSGLTDAYFADGITELAGNNGEFILTSAEEYLPEMYAGWQINPENGQPITLYFRDFSTEPSNDLVRIYDGPDTTAPLITVLDGSIDVEETEIISTSGSLFVLFTSDSQGQSSGFSAVYCTVPPQEEPLIQGQNFPCSGSNEVYLATGGPGSDFTWTPPAGWEILNPVNGGINLSIGAGRDSLLSTAVNRCGAGPSTWFVLEPRNAIPSLTGFIADLEPCAGDAAQVEVDESAGATYKWSLPQDWLGTSNTNRLDYVPGKAPGIITVQPLNACGTGNTLQIPVSVKNVPGEVQIMSEREQPCAFSLEAFYVDPKPDHSYHWEVGSDWSIVGDTVGDTILVALGQESDFLFVKAINKCGSRTSNRLFVTSPLPDDPLLKVTSSEYEGYQTISVSNYALYSGFEWYYNGALIEGSSDEDRSEIIAYLPGIYTVNVSNRDGCLNVMELSDGIEIDQPNQVYTVFSGPEGYIRILNTSGSDARVKVYDTLGRLLGSGIAGMGYSTLPVEWKGICIVQVSGKGDSKSTLLFVH